MNHENKELLLKDLCARLPYGVKCQFEDTIRITDGESNPFYDYILSARHLDLFIKNKNFHIKPYLRPLSSMTEEESKELQKITNNNFYASSNYISNSNSSLDGEWRASYNNFVTNDICNKLISWLDKNHFDHRTDEEGKTLIEKGLAIPVTKENNQYK